ncbi:hypothetical protein BFJ63_vAg17242 [Fusarium oxysporum f. sp. narcissi]|uniref:Uncharacterized protein n=1 Tax=Fusarium oxysporum f. sp. narcissi TaxID=451672 RepID=A0A4Q2V6N4_FUSOX|nr:hypothetical protein BFJ63_vAg17242 [Fusarium oxysporum f. sp. narcissi]
MEKASIFLRDAITSYTHPSDTQPLAFAPSPPLRFPSAE